MKFNEKIMGNDKFDLQQVLLGCPGLICLATSIAWVPSLAKSLATSTTLVPRPTWPKVRPDPLDDQVTLAQVWYGENCVGTNITRR